MLLLQQNKLVLLQTYRSHTVVDNGKLNSVIWPLIFVCQIPEISVWFSFFYNISINISVFPEIWTFPLETWIKNQLQ
jgi:hypothetical protein